MIPTTSSTGCPKPGALLMSNVNELERCPSPQPSSCRDRAALALMDLGDDDLAVDMLRVVNDLLQHKGLMLKTGTAVDATLISAPSSARKRLSSRTRATAAPTHRATAHPVRIDEPVAGATQVDGTGWTSPSDGGEDGMNVGRQGLHRPPNAINRRLDHSIQLTGLSVDTVTC